MKARCPTMLQPSSFGPRKTGFRLVSANASCWDFINQIYLVLHCVIRSCHWHPQSEILASLCPIASHGSSIFPRSATKLTSASSSSNETLHIHFRLPSVSTCTNHLLFRYSLILQLLGTHRKVTCLLSSVFSADAPRGSWATKTFPMQTDSPA